MNIKKLFDFRSKEEKINQYRKLLQKSQNVNKEIDNLADEFAQQNSIVKSIFLLFRIQSRDTFNNTILLCKFICKIIYLKMLIKR